MENYYANPGVILQECLFGLGFIENLVKMESEEDSEEETEEEEEKESFTQVENRDRGLKKPNEESVIEISSEEENDKEKKNFSKVKVKNENGGLKKITDEEVIEISSDESFERFEGKVGSKPLTVVTDASDDSLSEMIEGLKGIGNNPSREDSKTDSKDKIFNTGVVLPFGWDKMTREELIDEFLKLNEGKDIPDILLESLWEADYGEDTIIKDQKKMKKEKKVRNENRETKSNEMKMKIEKKTNNNTMKKSEDIEMLKLPSQFGFKRTVVKRNIRKTLDEYGNVVEGKQRIDIFYYPPVGKMLRSSNDVEKYLSQNQQHHLSLKNFSFSQKILDLGEFETVRSAGRKAMKKNDADKPQKKSKIRIKIDCKELRKKTNILVKKGKRLEKLMRKFSELAGMEGPAQLVFLCEGKILKETDSVNSLLSKQIDVQLRERGN